MGFLDAFKTTPRPDNSPLIPLPNGTQLSQLILARTYKRWEFREEMLRSKLQRLEKATMAGETTVEGIGSVELRKEVRRCRVEARSIRIKLESALEWEFNKRRTLTNRDAAGSVFILYDTPYDSLRERIASWWRKSVCLVTDSLRS